MLVTKFVLTIFFHSVNSAFAANVTRRSASCSKIFFIADFEFNTLYVYMSAQPLPIGVFGMGIDDTKITLLL